MKLLDEMLVLQLLTPDQHAEIGAWVRDARTPERILQMPPHLWKLVEGASALMDWEPRQGALH
jgi:hypothetical protein